MDIWAHACSASEGCCPESPGGWTLQVPLGRQMGQWQRPPAKRRGAQGTLHNGFPHWVRLSLQPIGCSLAPGVLGPMGRLASPSDTVLWAPGHALIPWDSIQIEAQHWMGT